jgi:20S proteasome alpha/beta subunit
MPGKPELTLIITFRGKAAPEVGGDALIIGSDSRETYGFVINPTRKIIPIRAKIGENIVDLCTVAGSGDSAILKNIFEIVEKTFSDKCLNDWSGRRPNYDQFSEAMHLVEQIVVNKLNYYRNSGLNVDISVIVEGVDSSGKASMWELDSRGVVQKIDDPPSFRCIGSGFILGGNLLVQQFLDPALMENINRGTLFVAYIIDQVSNVDPAVGPFDGEMLLIDKNGIHPWDKRQLPNLQAETKSRQILLRKMFMSFDVAGGAANLDSAITKGLELLAKTQAEKDKTPESK